jgi:hypothetical protein
MEMEINFKVTIEDTCIPVGYPFLFSVKDEYGFSRSNHVDSVDDAKESVIKAITERVAGIYPYCDLPNQEKIIFDNSQNANFKDACKYLVKKWKKDGGGNSADYTMALANLKDYFDGLEKEDN